MKYPWDKLVISAFFVIVLTVGTCFADTDSEVFFETGMAVLSSKLVNGVKAKIQSEKTRIAVSFFINDKKQTTLLSEEITFEIESHLSKLNHITLCNRKSLNKAIEEFKFQSGDYVDDESAIEIGKWVGANYIIFGSYANWGNQIKIKIKCLDIKDGVTIYADFVMVDKGSIPDNLFRVISYSGSKSLKKSRFVDNGDGTISDYDKGLMWEKSGSTWGDENHPAHTV